LATIYARSSRAEAAAVGGVGRRIVRDWVERFNAEGPEGLIDRKAPGQPPLLKAEPRAALVQAIEDGPILALLARQLPCAITISASRNLPMISSGPCFLPMFRLPQGPVKINQ
jgi:transposase